ncbi:FtsX-like permease family protein [Halobacteriovorax sp. XZX-3]|uniref:ABC transporter permease n=1 Tax=unclassified Halobacteriovorax TaxID=2639665 RepID=UPI000CD2ECEC|nr:FtsX-like permease family protein [Halobacteriovorax sp. DA5]POB14102.1 permease [Halobacteriovorax sp. DA5]
MLFLSMKQLFSKKKQTLLILLGISFGTMLYVAISGIQLGLRQYIIKALLNNTAHILISGKEDLIDRPLVNKWFYENKQVDWITPPYGKRSESKLENYQGWADRLSHHPDVYDFSPRLTIQVMLKRGDLTHSMGLIGTNARRQIRISDIPDYMVEGDFSSLASGGNKIILGAAAAEEIGARVGQYVEVIAGSLTHKNSFKIVGLFSFGDDRADKSIAFSHLEDVQKLNKTPGRVSEIAVSLFDMNKSQELADQWSLLSHDKVEDWKESNPMFMEMIMMQDIVRYFITIAILIVAAFGVYNVLTIMINQKRKEIAILRSIGYGPKRILELIMYQGIFLGVSGGVVGLILGFIICRAVESIELNINIGGDNHLLMDYTPSTYIIAFVAALVASLVASFLPALSASRMTPIDIIRGE